MLPLPYPRRGGRLDDLADLLNLDHDWPLVAAWLVGQLHPRGPYPVLSLVNEAGTGKTFTSVLLRSVLDPNQAPTRTPPRDSRDLMIAAHNAWVICFDNLSSLPGWLSDDLCRLATGSGFATRELYSDLDETIISAARPMILNGIADVARSGDLVDRSILLTPPPIGERQRRPETELFDRFADLHPGVFAALLDGAALAVADVERVTLERLPRMADFARWAYAAAPALGFDGDRFLAAYFANRRGADEAAVESSLIGSALVALMADRDRWHGTATQLLAALAAHVEPSVREHDRDWPASAQALGSALRRITPQLRRLGLHVTRSTGHHPRTLTVTRQEREDETPSLLSHLSLPAGSPPGVLSLPLSHPVPNPSLPSQETAGRDSRDSGDSDPPPLSDEPDQAPF
jgi:hypothetical protein